MIGIRRTASGEAYQPPGGKAPDITTLKRFMLLRRQPGQLRLFSSEGPFAAGISKILPQTRHLYCQIGGP